MKITYLLSILLLTGCVSNVHRLGKIGDHQFFSIHEQTLAGPNVAVIVAKTPDGKLDYISAANGPGVATAIIGAGGSVGSSLVLRPARTTVNTSAAGSSGASANGGSSSSTSESGSTSTSTSNTGSSNSFVPPGHQ